MSRRRALGRVVAMAIATATIVTVLAAAVPLGAQPVAARVAGPSGDTSVDDGGRRAPSSRYRPPLPGPVADRFRPPTSPYGPGNRGWEYRGVAGRPVRAAGDGVVAFAGQVGGPKVVSLDHPDGLRTTYSWLNSTTVRRGEHVSRGAIVGFALDVVHFGVRRGDRYLDPALLFGRLRARLVCVGAALPAGYVCGSEGR